LALQEHFAEDFDGLAFCDVGGGFEEGGVVPLDEQGQVGLDELDDEGLVFEEEYLLWY